MILNPNCGWLYGTLSKKDLGDASLLTVVDGHAYNVGDVLLVPNSAVVHFELLDEDMAAVKNEDVIGPWDLEGV